MASIGGLAPEILCIALSWACPHDVAAVAAAARSLDKAVASDELWSHWSSLLDDRKDRHSTLNSGKQCQRSDCRSAFRRRAHGSGVWHKLPAGGTAPSRRLYCAAASLGTNALIMQGGLRSRSRNSLCEDVWRLDVGEPGEPSVWTPLPEKTFDVGPGARGHQDVGVLAERFFVVHGGLRPQGYRDNDTFVLDLHAEPPCWEQVTPGVIHDPRAPTARFHHTFTVVNNGLSAVIFGGHDRTISAISDAAMLEVPKNSQESWAWHLAPSGQQGLATHAQGSTILRFGEADIGGNARAFHTANAIGDSSVVLFGGMDSDNRPLDDVRLLNSSDSSGFEVLPNGPRPPARSRHGSVVTGTELLVFGGAPGLTPWDRDPLDLWSIDLADAMKGRATGVWHQVAFTIWGTGSLGWPRHWLLPNLFISEGHAVAFGGHRSTRLFDHFGDATAPERMEAAGDAAGALAALPWHDLWRSREWRVLSTEQSDSWTTVATAAAIVTGTSTPLLLGVAPPPSTKNDVPDESLRNQQQCLGVFELRLSG